MSQFGQLMEDERVTHAALDVDEKAINPFDTGETRARPASQILGRGCPRLAMEVREHEPRPPVAGRWMTVSELRQLEDAGE